MTQYVRRQYDRIRVNWQIKVIPLKNKTSIYDIYLFDISSGGMSFTCDAEINVSLGDILIARFPFGSLKIKIVWFLEKTYGAMFMDSVSKLIIAQYLQ